MIYLVCSCSLFSLSILGTDSDAVYLVCSISLYLPTQESGHWLLHDKPCLFLLPLLSLYTWSVPSLYIYPHQRAGTDYYMIYLVCSYSLFSLFILGLFHHSICSHPSERALTTTWCILTQRLCTDVNMVYLVCSHFLFSLSPYLALTVTLSTLSFP